MTEMKRTINLHNGDLMNFDTKDVSGRISLVVLNSVQENSMWTEQIKGYTLGQRFIHTYLIPAFSELSFRRLLATLAYETIPVESAST